MERNKQKKARRQMTVNVKEPANPEVAQAEPLSKGGMSPVLQDQIGRQVRAMFDEVAEEPIPDHLLQLLQNLDKSGEQ